MHSRILLSRKIFIAMFSVLSNYHHGKHRKPCSSVMIRKNRNILLIRTLQFLRKEHLTRVQHFIPFTHCANTIKFRRKISGGPERKILLLWSYVGYFSGKGKNQLSLCRYDGMVPQVKLSSFSFITKLEFACQIEPRNL